ncbi:hypothetical protein T11_11495 [Trichinella zimbabwensis]|uniref:Uncharacterized protein n=1 Tax=Trichinella zimbabwensis TaxID=268475 RepID=A0A0V1H786_9BILA|nr:hypothetical protein T11_11495 [Trichinella zimbabwensis]
MFSDDTIAIAMLISGGGPRKKPLPALGYLLPAGATDGWGGDYRQL